MTMENDTPVKPRPRWLYPVLIASLAANFLVLGGAAGAMWAHRHGHGGPDERGLLGFVRELAPERRDSIREGLASEREKLQPLREAVRANWSETNAILGEEPFDKEKFKASLGRMNEAEMRVRTAITDALAETAGKLSPQERRTLKEWRERKGYGHRRFGGRRHHEGGKDD